MAVIISGSAEKGVAKVGTFSSDNISPFRFFVRLAPVPANNIRLLGIVRFERRVNTFEAGQFYTVERFEVRSGRDSFASAQFSGYLANDLVLFIPLFDFTTCIINDLRP